MQQGKQDKVRMNNLTRGGQVTMNNFHMWVQVTKILTSIFIFSALAIFVLTIWCLLSLEQLHAAAIYVLAIIKAKIFSYKAIISINWDGHLYHIPIYKILSSAYFYSSYHLIISAAYKGLLFGSIAAIPVTWLVNHYFIKQGKKLSEDRFVRGMRLETPKVLEKELKKAGESSDFCFDRQYVFKKDFEVQHLLLDGTTGAGKSVALRKLLLWIRDRGDKAIIYDKGCTYVSKFFNEKTDFIMNPFDERSVNWDVWCDGKEDTDFENMANALIPMHGEGDPFWVHAARSIFSSASITMSADPERSIIKLLEVMLKSNLENLSQYLEGTESEALVSDKNAKTAISIKSVLATYIKSLRFLEGLEFDENGKEKQKFSIKEWVAKTDEKGWLFISSNAEQHASLRPLISMWLSIASTSILGLEENYNQRIWVIVDEVPSLHKLPELPETISEVRKFGGCYVLGMQSVAQLRKIYGMNAANEIFDLLNTRLFFRSPSQEMAEITSKELGDQELEICKDNRSVGPNAIRDGATFGFQNVVRRIVTSSEIMQLPDLSCYLRTPGEYPVIKMNLKFDQFDSQAVSFIKRKNNKTEREKYIEALSTHYQIGNLNNLDAKTRSQLLAMQENTFDNKEHDLQEMKESVKSVNDKSNSKGQEKILDPVGVEEYGFMIEIDK